MGGGNWTDDAYDARQRAVKSSGYSTSFTHDVDVRAGRASALHDSLNIKGKIRESRDSAEHPVTTPIAVLFDVTGSMGSVPRTLQTKLPKLLSILLEQKYVEGPQILTGGIGDATCDTVPIQISQFESDIRIDEDLGKIFLEGGGGGQKFESYELAMYFMARRTVLDSWEKRGKKGYLFIIGDEKARDVSSKYVVDHIGGLAENMKLENLVNELHEMYEVYFIIPNLSSYYDDRDVNDFWKKLFGERVIKLENPDLVCEAIASIIGANEGYHVKDTAKKMSLSSHHTASLSKALSEVKVKTPSTNKMSVSKLELG